MFQMFLGLIFAALGQSNSNSGPDGPDLGPMIDPDG